MLQLFRKKDYCDFRKLNKIKLNSCSKKPIWNTLKMLLYLTWYNKCFSSKAALDAEMSDDIFLLNTIIALFIQFHNYATTKNCNYLGVRDYL